MISVIIGLAAAGAIGAGIAGLFVVGIVGRRKELPHRLPRSGARCSPMPWATDTVDALLMDVIAAYDHEMAHAPGTSKDAFRGVQIHVFEDDPLLEGLQLPHRSDAAGQAFRPAALRLEVAVAPGAPVGRTALCYEGWRRLLRYEGRTEWEADNRKGSPSRWPKEWFDAIAEVDRRYR